ncbi:hypothetical protein LCGC14_2872000 [marine sediment metagenome]|uniref:Uncharacterized protein n=1 Tax=marine sediment metagenome TaxID=412755 RepID=A0A0F8YPE3_9ZZZZ
MKVEDVIDTGIGLGLGEKTVGQLLNGYARFCRELGNTKITKDEEKRLLEALEGVYTEVHKRVDPELLNQG